MQIDGLNVRSDGQPERLLAGAEKWKWLEAWRSIMTLESVKFFSQVYRTENLSTSDRCILRLILTLLLFCGNL